MAFDRKRVHIKIIIVVLMSCLAMAFTMAFVFIFGGSYLVRSVLKNINMGINGKFGTGKISILPGSFEVDEPVLTLADGMKFGHAKKIVIDYSPLEFIKKRSFTGAIKKIKIVNPEITIVRDEQGSFNYSHIWNKGVSQINWEKIVKKFRGSVHIAGGGLNFRDRYKTTFSASASDIQISLEPQGKSLFSVIIKGQEKGKSVSNIEGSGLLDLSNPYVSINLSGTALDMSTWGNYLLKRGKIWFTGGRGHLNIELRGAGRDMKSFVSSLYLHWTLSVKEMEVYLTFLGATIKKVSGIIEFGKSYIDVKKISGDFEGAVFELKGIIYNGGDPVFDLSLTAKGFDVEKLSALKILKNEYLKNAKGIIACAVHIGGSAKNLDVAGRFEVKNGKIYDLDLKSAEFEGRFTSGNIRIDKFQSNVNGGNVRCSGWIFPRGNQLLLSLKGEDSKFCWKTEKGKNIGGFADFALDILGELSKPVVIGKALFKEFKIGQETYGRSFADFIFSEGTLYLKEGEVSKSGGLLKASGIVDMKNEDMDLLVRASSFPLPSISIPEIGRLQGEVSGMMKFFGTFSTPLACGVIGPPGFFRVGSIALHDPFIPLQYGGDFLSISRGNAICAGNPVKFRGDVMLQSSPFMRIALQSQRTDLLQLFRESTIPFQAMGEGDLKITLTGGPSAGFLWNGEGKVNEGRFQSSGWVSPTNNWISFVSLQSLPLDSMRVSFNKKSYPLKGTLDCGEALLSGGHSTIKMGCSLSFLGASFMGFPFSSLYSDMFLSGSALTILDTDVRGPAGRLSFDGLVDLRKKDYTISGDGAALDVEYMTRNLDLSPWGINIMHEMERRNVPKVRGLLWASGTLKNNGNSPRFNGEVSLRDGMLASEALSLESRFSVIPHAALLNDLVVHAGKSTFNGKGKVTYSPEVSLDMNVTVKRGDLSRIMNFTPWKDLALRGDVDGDFRIRGKSTGTLVNGNVFVTKGAIGDQPIEEVSADFTTRDNNLCLENLFITFPSGQIRGSGKISSSGTVDMNFTAVDFPVEHLEMLKKYVGKVGGTISFDMKVGGARTNPQFSMNFNGNELFMGSGKERSYLSCGTLHWRDNTLYIDQVSLIHNDEKYNFNGSISFPGKKIPQVASEWTGKDRGRPPILDIRAELSNAQFENILQHISGKADVKGKVDGEISIKGDLGSPSYDVDVVVKDGKIKGVPIEKAVAKIKYEKRRFDITSIELKMPLSSIQVKGTIGTVTDTADNEVTVDVQNMDLALLSSFLPRPFKLAGILDMKARVAGSIMFPDVSSQMKITKGILGGFDFDSLQGRVVASKGVFSLKDFFVEEQGSRITVSGDIPIMIDKNNIVSTAPMDIQAHLRASDLDMLSFVIPLEGKTSGSLNGNMEISGVFPDIIIKGLVSIKDGLIQPAALKRPITDINADVAFADEKIVVKSMQGRMGQGNFGIGGELDISGSSLKNVDLKMMAKDLELFAKQYYSGKTDMDLSLKGDGSKQVLLGKIIANNSTIHIPTEVLMKDSEENARRIEEFKKSIPSCLRNLFVNVHVNLDNDNWFTFLTSALLMKGGITLAGRVPELALSGEVDLYRGTLNLPFLETPFKVYQGKAYFDGQDWSPYLSLEAEAEIGKYHVYMDCTGKLENPRVELISEPPMQQDELKRMLAGTMISNFITGGELAADAMATRLAERVLDLNLIQPIFHALGRTFGLSDVAVEYTYDNVWSIRVAKALDSRERLLVTYDRVMLRNGTLQNLYGLEYRFRKGMLVRVSQDDMGRIYYWIQTKYRY